MVSSEQAGSDLGERAPQILVIGQAKWSLGELGPILRALGIGFVLGLMVTAAIALLGN